MSFLAIVLAVIVAIILAPVVFDLLYAILAIPFVIWEDMRNDWVQGRNKK